MTDDERRKDPSDEELDRASRIREGREGRGRRSPSRTSQASQSSSTSETSQTAQTDDVVDPSEVPLKERTHDTFYYLDEFAEELDLARDMTNLRLAQEYGADAKLEKNRHFRPLVLRLGMDALEELSPAEIRERLQEDDLLDDPPGPDA